MNATLPELVTQVRRLIDEKVASGVDVSTDEQTTISGGSAFSDDEIEYRLVFATRFIVARVKARYIPQFVETSTNFSSEIDPTNDEKSIYVQRVLADRIEAGSIPATRRTFEGHRKLTSSGRAASVDSPVFAYEDYELMVDQGSGSNVVSVSYVRVPGRNIKQDGTVATPTVDITKLDDRFRSALVQHAAFGCLFSALEIEVASKLKQSAYESIGPYMLPRFSEKKLQENQ